MKIFLGIFGVLFWSSFSFLNATLATNADLGSALPLHLLQAVTTGTDEETEEIDLRELLDRDINLFRRTLRPLHLVVFNRGTEVRVVFHGTVDESDALFFKLLAIADLASVGTTTVGIVRWRGRGGACSVVSRAQRCDTYMNIPFPLRRDKVIQAQLAIDLLQPQMNCIVVQVSL